MQNKGRGKKKKSADNFKKTNKEYRRIKDNYEIRTTQNR